MTISLAYPPRTFSYEVDRKQLAEDDRQAKKSGGEGGIRAKRDEPRASRSTPEGHPNRQDRAQRGIGGEGGIRTHVPVTRQDAFEAPPLRPLRYLSGSGRVPPSATRLRRPRRNTTL